MSAANRYFLDGIDMYTAYGFIVTGGSDAMLQLAKRKDPLSHNWNDEDGIEYDLTSAPVYEDKKIPLKGYLVATSEADFWNKYNALKVALDFSGTKVLTCTEIGTSLNIFYRECSELKRRTRIKNTDLIGMEMDLLFQEVL